MAPSKAIQKWSERLLVVEETGEVCGQGCHPFRLPWQGHALALALRPPGQPMNASYAARERFHLKPRDFLKSYRARSEQFLSRSRGCS